MFYDYNLQLPNVYYILRVLFPAVIAINNTL